MRRWAAALLLVVACGDDSAPPAEDAAVDMGVDTAPPPMSVLFGPCVQDSQCPGAGAFCRTGADGFPQGQCTLPCEDRGPCDDGVVFNHCLPDPDNPDRNICQQSCLNAQDCGRENYICVGRTDMRDGICIGFCDDDADCGEGAECNVHAGTCVAAGTVPTEGARTGEGCMRDDDCLSGACILEERDLPTGWNGGYCLGACRIPAGYNTNTFYSGDAYPTEQCPDNNVCYPADSYARGNEGLCLTACETDDDCRASEGYFCDRMVSLTSGDTKTFTNGICFPIDCSMRDCPTGYACEGYGSGTQRRFLCVRE
ncbi:MAG: hypothetical protein AAGE52_22060 [Myxococcota bacterium]